MNYKILDIDPLEQTILIEWEDGVTLNHAIPADYLEILIKREGGPIRSRPQAFQAIDAKIRKERG